MTPMIAPAVSAGIPTPGYRATPISPTGDAAPLISFVSFYHPLRPSAVLHYPLSPVWPPRRQNRFHDGPSRAESLSKRPPGGFRFQSRGSSGWVHRGPNSASTLNRRRRPDGKTRLPLPFPESKSSIALRTLTAPLPRAVKRYRSLER